MVYRAIVTVEFKAPERVPRAFMVVVTVRFIGVPEYVCVVPPEQVPAVGAVGVLPSVV